MKIAEINSPSEISKYAQRGNFNIIEIVEKEEYPHLTKTINSCFDKARNKKCVEVYVKEITQHYNIMLDKISWNVHVIGFVRL